MWGWNGCLTFAGVGQGHAQAQAKLLQSGQRGGAFQYKRMGFGLGIGLAFRAAKAPELIKSNLERRQLDLRRRIQRTRQHRFWRGDIAAQPLQGDVQAWRADDGAAMEIRRAAQCKGLRADPIGIFRLRLHCKEKFARIARCGRFQARHLHRRSRPAKEAELVCHVLASHPWKRGDPSPSLIPTRSLRAACCSRRTLRG